MVKPRDSIPNIEVCMHGGINRNYLRAIGVKNHDKIIDFSSNLNPYGPPKFVLKALMDAADKINMYPDRESTELRELIADALGCADEEILVAAGITELIQLSALTFIDKNRAAVIPEHTYGEYEVMSRIMGARIKYIKMPSLRLELQSILDEISEGNVLFLCNPNNPTGQYLNEEEIKTLIAKVEEVNALLIVDEAYVDFVENSFPSEKFARNSDNFILLRSFTKSFAVPGIRLGYAVGTESNIKYMRKVKPPWTVSPFAQSVGIAAVKNRKFLDESRKKITKSKKLIEANLDVVPSDANFYLFRVGNSSAMVKKLLMHNMLVRDCTSFNLAEYIRFSVKKDIENKVLVDALIQI